MGQVVLEITMSVDDFAAGPDVGRALPMGEGGERIHAWLGGGAGSESAVDRAVANETFASTGAFVMGRRTFDVGESSLMASRAPSIRPGQPQATRMSS